MSAALLAAVLAVAQWQSAADEGGLRVTAPHFALRLVAAAGWDTLEGQPSPGTELATLEVSGRFVDYRGQRVPDGQYTLLLALQPPLKDHFGTAPAPEFALLVNGPAAGGALERARRTAGGAHPLVLRLALEGGSAPAGVLETPAEVLARPRPGRAALVIVGRAREPEY